MKHVFSALILARRCRRAGPCRLRLSGRAGKFPDGTQATQGENAGAKASVVKYNADMERT
jgi:hypothetical protein